MKRRTITRTPEQVETKMIGVQIPLSLHQEIRECAAREHLSASSLFRKLIINHLDAQAGQGK